MSGTVTVANLPALSGVSDSTPLVAAGGKLTALQLKQYIGSAGGAGGPALATTNPAPLAATAAPGTALTAARSDHAHARPTAAEVGAAPVVHTHTVADIAGLSVTLSTSQPTSEKGQANGYASLDNTGRVPVSQLPTAAGTIGGINVAISGQTTGQVLRYNGVQFVNATLVPADVSGLPVALNTKQDTSARGVVNGYAGLDASGYVPLANLPSGLLTNVAVSGAVAGHVLRWNGAQFTNAFLGVADVSGLQAALNAKQTLSEKGGANGYAGLDSGGRVPTAQLPANLVTTDYRNVPLDFSSALTVGDSDNNRLRRCTAATDCPVTLSASSVGTTVRFIQAGAGKVAFVAGIGTTLNAYGGLTRTAGQYADATATVVAANTWHISGILAA